MSIEARARIVLTFNTVLRGAVGAPENSVPPGEEPAASADPATGGGDAGGGGTGGGGTGGGGGGATAPQEQFVSCKSKYGISEDEAAATDGEGSAHPYGTTPEGLARQRAVEEGRAADADPMAATSNDAQVVPVGCGADVKNAAETFQLSPQFTVSSLSSHAALPHAIGNGSVSKDPTTGQSRAYGRAEIVCNMKHLATNALEKIFTHFKGLGYTIQISSGYRPGTPNAGSDHHKGSAADLIFFYDGKRVGGQHLTRIQLCIDQHLRIPYTQMIFETPGSNGDILHVACRRVGGRSGLRNGWSTGNGHSGSMHSGYKYTVTLDGLPRVK